MANHDGETQLTLRIDLDADPITGSLSSPHGTHHRFSGWIALAAALEATRRELAPRPHRQPDPPTAPKPHDDGLSATSESTFN